MPKVSVSLPDEAFAEVRKLAAAEGILPDAWIKRLIERDLDRRATEQCLRKHVNDPHRKRWFGAKGKLAYPVWCLR